MNVEHGGTSLQKLLEAKQAMAQADAIRVALDLMHALESEHQLGKILGGIFPDQVVVNLQSGSRLLALGAVRDPEELTVSYLYFVPPECLENKQATQQSDLYSAGIILYALLAGHVPFQATSREELLKEILSGTSQTLPPSAANAGLEWIIRRCMLSDPTRRFQTAQEVIQELKKCAAPQKIADRMAIHRPRAMRHFQQRWKLWAPVSGVFLLLLSLVLFFLIREPAPSDPQHWNVRRLTSEKFDEQDPTLSPGNSAVAYVSNRAGNWDLYIMNLIEKDPVKITRSPGFEENPRWSPKGDQILYTYRWPFVKPTILSISPSGGVPQELVKDAIDAQWSSDGEEICYVKPADGPVRSLYVFNLNQEKERLILKDVSGLRHPSFSQNGKEIVVWIDQHLELVKTGSGKRKILTSGSSDSYPTWNWKTESIYFTSLQNGKAQIWRTDRSSGNRAKVSESDLEDSRPAPTLSGDQVVFHRRSELTEVVSIDIKTGTVILLAPAKAKGLFTGQKETPTQKEQEMLSGLLQSALSFARRPSSSAIGILTPSEIVLAEPGSNGTVSILKFEPGEKGNKIAWSKNGKTLYCERIRHHSDVYVMSAR